MRNNGNIYDEIPDENGDFHRSFWDTSKFCRSWSLMKVFMLGMVALLVGIIVVQGVHEHDIEIEHLELEYQTELSELQHEVDTNYYNEQLLDNNRQKGFVPFVSRNAKLLPMPTGVNLGSWLSLEDYFFAGLHNSVEVATPGQLDSADTVAACLPPLHVGSTTGPKWQSETDLFSNLMDPNITKNGSARHAIEVFAAHRASFVDMETDLQRLKALGITTVRVPMSWCWKDKDPRKIDLGSYDSENDLLKDFSCEDPFYDRVLWPAVPKPFVEDLLRACANAGLKASLDVHTYPGGTSIGTFSGVWPNWPRFWTHGGDGIGTQDAAVDTSAKGFDIGHKLFGQLVEWMEDLSARDPEAFSGLRGLSPMNEPAHLAGIFDEEDPNNFLPPLPRDLADDYLDFLDSHSGDGDYSYPDGTHLRVFYWFQGAIEIFRKSKLPSLGTEIQANIHESVFQLLAEPWESWRVDAKLRGKAIATWWCSQASDNKTHSNFQSTTSPEERSDWAVMDMHHYHAWSDVCSGTIDGQDAAYACGDAEKRSEVLDSCVGWVQEFRDIIDGVCGTNDAAPAKLMSAEFSAASHHSVRRSCSDTSGLRESFTKQVEAASRANVDLFYWSYKMPYGGSFKGAGWSFTEIMYKFGVFGRPDTPQFDCDAHLYDDPEVP